MTRARPEKAVSVRRKIRKTLFYRETPGGEELVFAPPEVAEYVSAIYNAMEAKTWGEFKARMPLKEYKRLVKKAQDGETDQDKLPSDDNSLFDPGDWFPEWFDGDYPDWIQQRQAEWLPKSIIKRYAEQLDFVHNGFFWSIKSGSKTSILRELSRAGFTVKHRNDLTFY